MDLFTSSEIDGEDVFSSNNFVDNYFHFPTPPSGSDDGYWTDSMSSLSPSSIFSGQNSYGESTDFPRQFSCGNSSHLKETRYQKNGEVTEFINGSSGDLERVSIDNLGTFPVFQNDHSLFSLPPPTSLMNFPGNHDIHMENLKDELFCGFHEELVKQCDVALNGTHDCKLDTSKDIQSLRSPFDGFPDSNLSCTGKRLSNNVSHDA
eukprot:TCONS_00021875-protein